MILYFLVFFVLIKSFGVFLSLMCFVLLENVEFKKLWFGFGIYINGYLLLYVRGVCVGKVGKLVCFIFFEYNFIFLFGVGSLSGNSGFLCFVFINECLESEL